MVWPTVAKMPLQTKKNLPCTSRIAAQPPDSSRTRGEEVGGSGGQGAELRPHAPENPWNSGLPLGSKLPNKPELRGLRA